MKPSWEKVYKANYSRKSKLISFTNSKKTPYYTGCVPQYLPQFPLTVLTMLPQEKKKKNHSGLPQIYHRLSSLYIREKYIYIWYTTTFTTSREVHKVLSTLTVNIKYCILACISILEEKYTKCKTITALVYF